MTTLSAVPDAAVEAAKECLRDNIPPPHYMGDGEAYFDGLARRILTAALPHLVAEKDAAIESLLEEVKAHRADHDPLLKAANEGAARIKLLEGALDQIVRLGPPAEYERIARAALEQTNEHS